jgi:hypothetical protein
VHVRLVITLKQSIRRCLYRRWEGEVVGREVRTKTVDLDFYEQVARPFFAS